MPPRRRAASRTRERPPLVAPTPSAHDVMLDSGCDRKRQLSQPQPASAHSAAGKVVSIGLVPSGYGVDRTKRDGFRIQFTASEAAASILRRDHNEFANMATDVLPAIFFAAATVATCIMPLDGTPLAFRQAVAGVFVSSCVQHLSSLFAHCFQAMSAELSYAVWFVDFAGIVQNFAWNGMGMIFICYPALLDGKGPGGTEGGVWPFYFFWNSALSAMAFVAAARVLRHGVPSWLPALSADGIDTRGSNGDAASGAGRGGTALLAALAGFVLCILSACEVATVVLASRGDANALGALLLLPFALAIKQAHWPEVWLFRTGALHPGALDFSWFHSHCIWHVLVIGVQGFYFAIYVSSFRAYAALSQ